MASKRHLEDLGILQNVCQQEGSVARSHIGLIGLFIGFTSVPPFTQFTGEERGQHANALVLA
ncbi:MAG: hypothetical protein B7Z15_00280 [Rhizobiales bacterium 32-66-8]|nr:MAG: hypothetical protein B7Z15_00280 [Rhizobiales bacterium 32-66-8]